MHIFLITQILFQSCNEDKFYFLNIPGFNKFFRMINQ